jgi:hypothetical protein
VHGNGESLLGLRLHRWRAGLPDVLTACMAHDHADCPHQSWDNANLSPWPVLTIIGLVTAFHQGNGVETCSIRSCHVNDNLRQNHAYDLRGLVRLAHSSSLYPGA